MLSVVGSCRLTGNQDGHASLATTLCTQGPETWCCKQVLQLSGIVALFFTGICHAHYSYYSVERDAQITLRRFFQFAAFISETFVFAFLGLQVCSLPE